MLKAAALCHATREKQKGGSQLTRLRPCPFVRWLSIENAAHHRHAGFLPNQASQPLLMDPHLFHPAGDKLVFQIPFSKPRHRPCCRLVLSRNALAQLCNFALIVVWCRHVSHFLSQHNPFILEITPSCSSNVQCS